MVIRPNLKETDKNVEWALGLAIDAHPTAQFKKILQKIDMQGIEHSMFEMNPNMHPLTTTSNVQIW